MFDALSLLAVVPGPLQATAVAPLQATVPTTLRPALAVAVVAAVAHVAFRLYGRRAIRGANPGSALRRALLVGLPVVAVVALVAVLLADLPALLDGAVATVLPPFAGTAASAAVVQFGVGLAVVVAVLAGYLGALPALREVRDLDLDAGRATRRLGRFLVVLLVVLVVVVRGIDALAAVASPPVALAVGTLALLVTGLAGAPLLVRLTRATREPTAAERERLDDLLATANVPAGRVLVVEADEEEVGQAFVRGLPGYRHLFVTDYLLAGVEDDRAATVLAVAAGQVRYGYVAVRATVLAGGVAALGVELIFGPVAGLAAAAGLPGVAGSLAVVLVVASLLAAGRRLVYRVDDYAADRVGARTVARSLEAGAEKYGLGLESGRLASLVAMRPSLGRRIDRLYARSSDED